MKATESLPPNPIRFFDSESSDDSDTSFLEPQSMSDLFPTLTRSRGSMGSIADLNPTSSYKPRSIKSAMGSRKSRRDRSRSRSSSRDKSRSRRRSKSLSLHTTERRSSSSRSSSRSRSKTPIKLFASADSFELPGDRSQPSSSSSSKHTTPIRSALHGLVSKQASDASLTARSHGKVTASSPIHIKPLSLPTLRAPSLQMPQPAPVLDNSVVMAQAEQILKHPSLGTVQRMPQSLVKSLINTISDPLATTSQHQLSIAYTTVSLYLAVNPDQASKYKDLLRSAERVLDEDPSFHPAYLLLAALSPAATPGMALATIARVSRLTVGGMQLRVVFAAGRLSAGKLREVEALATCPELGLLTATYQSLRGLVCKRTPPCRPAGLACLSPPPVDLSASEAACWYGDFLMRLCEDLATLGSPQLHELTRSGVCRVGAELFGTARGSKCERRQKDFYSHIRQHQHF